MPLVAFSELPPVSVPPLEVRLIGALEVVTTFPVASWIETFTGCAIAIPDCALLGGCCVKTSWVGVPAESVIESLVAEVNVPLVAPSV